jgi:hypothetical protein
MPGEVDEFLPIVVHAMFPKMRIVITSGLHPGTYLRDVADAFFSKPYDPAAVAGRVKELIADSERDVSLQ